MKHLYPFGNWNSQPRWVPTDRKRERQFEMHPIDFLLKMFFTKNNSLIIK